MTAQERAIAEVFPVTDGICWEAAAVTAGSPPEVGSRLKRKRLWVREEPLQRSFARR